MRWNARGTMALVVSALVGVIAGVVVGFTTGSSPPAKAGPGGPLVEPERSPARPTTRWASASPLGEPRLHRRHHPGRRLGRDPRDAQPTPCPPTPTESVKYLETAELLQHAVRRGEAGPARVRRLPRPLRQPRPSRAALRMSIDHTRDVVTSLKRGVKIHVQCLCVAGARRPSRPGRRHGAPTPATASTSAPSNGCSSTSGPNPASRITGEYDAQTRDVKIQELQELNAIDAHALPAASRSRRGRCCATAAASQYDF